MKDIDDRDNRHWCFDIPHPHFTKTCLNMGGGLSQQHASRDDGRHPHGLIADSDGLYPLTLLSKDLATLKSFEGGKIVECAVARYQQQRPVAEHVKRVLSRMGSTNTKLLAEQQGSDLVTDEALAPVFLAFCAYGRHGDVKVANRLDRQQWAKMMHDCKLLNQRYTNRRAELLFAKAAGRDKTLTMKRWLEILPVVVKQSGTDIDFVRANIAVSKPLHSGTTTGSECAQGSLGSHEAVVNPENCKLQLHQEIANFNSTRKTLECEDSNCKPGVVTLKFTRNELWSLQHLNAGNDRFVLLMSVLFANTEVEKSNAEVDGKSNGATENLSKEAAQLVPMGLEGADLDSYELNPAAAAMPHTPKKKSMLPAKVTESELHAVFYAYCAFGKKRGRIRHSVLEGGQFSKMVKDCKLLRKSFNAVAVDILFATMARNAKTITLHVWVEMLGHIAKAISMDVLWVRRMIVCNGTLDRASGKTKHNRLHNDSGGSNLKALSEPKFKKLTRQNTVDMSFGEAISKHRFCRGRSGLQISPYANTNIRPFISDHQE